MSTPNLPGNVNRDAGQRSSAATGGDTGSEIASGNGLTNQRLIRFAIVIVVMIVATLAIAIWSVRAESSNVKSTRPAQTLMRLSTAR